MARETVRILSDLHFLEGSSRVRRLEQLAPLFDGVDNLIINGDCIDTQNGDPTGEATAALKAYFKSRVRSVTWLTGNHDPDISDTHELSLADGRIWVTHGDILFDELAPWSRYRPEIARRLTAAYDTIPAHKRSGVDTRLRVFRQISHGLPREHDPIKSGALMTLMRYWSVCFPPRCAFALLHSWWNTPRFATALAATHRPQAGIIINGHTHFPGVWRRDGRTVINTGSFCGPFHGQTVDLCGDQLRVRPIVERRGEFSVGTVSREIPLAQTAPSPLSATP